MPSPEPHFLIGQPVPFLGGRTECLGEHLPRRGLHGSFAGAGHEECSRDTDGVRKIHGVKEKAICILAEVIHAQVRLQAVGAVTEFRERCLAHRAEQHDASGNGNGRCSSRESVEVCVRLGVRVGAMEMGRERINPGLAEARQFGPARVHVLVSVEARWPGVRVRRRISGLVFGHNE